MNKKAGEIPLKPFETKRASELIYEQIKDLIVSGQLAEGDRLPSERALMEQLQRSRPTIREALRMLERTGFIRILPGPNGVVVQSPATQNVTRPLATMLEMRGVSMEELAEYRMQNDVAIACWATFRHTKEDLSAIDALLEKAQSLLESKDYEPFILLDPEFHGLLARAAKNEVAFIMTQVLSEINHERLRAALNRLEEEERRQLCEDIFAQHRKIRQVIEGGTEEEATEVMAQHIYSFISRLRPSEPPKH